MKLTDGLYAYIWQGNDNNCNSYIFANTLRDDKHILIDPGHIITPYLKEPAYEMLAKNITKDGLRLEDIGLILLTHAHPDHIEAAAKIKEKSQAPIALHESDNYIYKNFYHDTVDYLLKEGGLELDSLVKVKIEIIHSPGHSPGQIAIYWPEKKALVVGDVVFYRSTGRFDLPGGDGLALNKSIERLSHFEIEYLLCGHPYGHPGVIKGKAEVEANFDFLKENFWF